MKTALLRMVGALPLMSLLAVSTAAAAQPVKEPPPEVSDATGRLRTQTIANFQRDLDFIGAGLKVQECQLVLSYVPQDGIGRDTSWGAVCTVQGKGAPPRLLMACNDELIGKFTLKFPSYSQRKSVTDFIARNCPPGG